MSKVHTHYDNLKVARNAPPEVIQAAYRALSLKHHPDHNPGDPEAARIMALINAAYEVLSDPAKRADHDAWISRREAELARQEASANAAANAAASAASRSATVSQPWTRQPPPTGAAGRPSWGRAAGTSASSGQAGASGGGDSSGAASKSGRRRGVLAHVGRNWFFYVVALALVWKLGPWNAPQDQEPAPQPAPERPAAKVSRRPAPKRAHKADASAVAAGLAAAAANASAEDAQTAGGHASAAARASASNRCHVVLDNRQGGAALVARLVRLDGSVTTREFAVPARGSMTVRDVPPGAYEVRYRNPSTGETRKTEPFTLREAMGDDGQLHSDVLTLTTFNVPGGNMRTAPMKEGEF